jgi:hypothetical protein
MSKDYFEITREDALVVVKVFAALHNELDKTGKSKSRLSRELAHDVKRLVSQFESFLTNESEYSTAGGWSSFHDDGCCFNEESDDDDTNKDLINDVEDE